LVVTAFADIIKRDTLNISRGTEKTYPFATTCLRGIAKRKMTLYRVSYGLGQNYNPITQHVGDDGSYPFAHKKNQPSQESGEKTP
jgi:hypothetical protein